MLVSPKPDKGNDADWQTVTTDNVLQPPISSNEFLAKGTGSSLADISDTSEHDFCQCNNGSTERIIQHPQRSGGNVIYRLRHDKQTDRPVLLPTFNGNQNGFLGNSSRQPYQSQPRAGSAIRRFSNNFRRDHSSDRHVTSRPRVFEMNSFGHSYDSLSSDYGFQGQELEGPERPAKQPRFQWSRIQESLSRGTPKSPLGVFDQPLYRSTGKKDSPSPRHDEFLGDIPSLPFPIISLPEAALVQRFRRERGEEDHTEQGASFSAKARSGTVSTISSSQPRTPLSTYFDQQPSSPPALYTRPPRMPKSRRNTNRRTASKKLPSFFYVSTDTA